MIIYTIHACIVGAGPTIIQGGNIPWMMENLMQPPFHQLNIIYLSGKTIVPIAAWWLTPIPKSRSKIKSFHRSNTYGVHTEDQTKNHKVWNQPLGLPSLQLDFSNSTTGNEMQLGWLPQNQNSLPGFYPHYPHCWSLLIAKSRWTPLWNPTEIQ